MVKIALVGLGGALGAVARYLLYEAALVWARHTWIPLGTLVVNLLGCFAIGLLGGLAETRNMFSPDLRAIIFIGFLGGFTTFSTFGFETVFFIRNGQPGLALANILVQVTAGLAAVWAGISLARVI